MSKLRELIDELCPDGVEYVELGTIADIGTGRSDRKDAVQNGAYPFYVRSQEVLRKNDYEYDEEAILVPGEGSIGQVFHFVNGKYALHQRVYRIHITSNTILTMFVKRYMESEFLEFITREAVTATVKSIRKPMIQKFRIPVPPIEVQREVVRILDSFQELDYALTAEIEAREKQFDYVLSRMFDESHMNKVAGKAINPVPLKRVRERVITPIRAKPTDFTGTIPWCKLEDVTGFEIGDSLSGKMVSEETIQQMGLNVYPEGTVLASCSATLGVYCVTQKPLVTNQRFMGFVCGKGLHNRYLMYALKASNSRLMMQATTGTNAYISRRAFDECLIQVPDFELQQRISGELDCAYEHLNSLRDERDARRKQFGHYRDKLLSFPEKEAS